MVPCQLECQEANMPLTITLCIFPAWRRHLIYKQSGCLVGCIAIVQPVSVAAQAERRLMC